MAKISNEARLAQAIYQHIGGPTNTSKVYNCMTRVRIDIKDDQKVDMESLKQQYAYNFTDYCMVTARDGVETGPAGV